MRASWVWVKGVVEGWGWLVTEVFEGGIWGGSGDDGVGLSVVPVAGLDEGWRFGGSCVWSNLLLSPWGNLVQREWIQCASCWRS